MNRKRYVITSADREMIIEAETSKDATEVFIRRMVPGDTLGSIIRIYPLEENETKIDYDAGHALIYFIDPSDPWFRSLMEELGLKVTGE